MTTHRSESPHAPVAARPGRERPAGGRSLARPGEAHPDEGLRACYHDHAAECLNRAVLGRRHGPLG